MIAGRKFKSAALSTLILAVVAAVPESAMAHTRLQTSQMDENTRTYNNVVLGHGCGDNSVMGTSVVFPDGVDSTITVDGEPYDGALTSFVTNWTNANQQIYSRALFTYQNEKTDSNGNVVGFWAGGESLPHNLIGLVPFRTNAVIIEPTSCAASVKFYVSIVDICEITNTEGFGESTVGLWTHNNLGTVYDRVSETDDGPASLQINRTSALPESCGATGVTVEVRSSAAQINRDMPIVIDGQQIWPKP